MAVMENPNPRPRSDPHSPQSKAGQGFLKFYRPIYRFFGFQKGYNFPLYVIFLGALLGFALARLQYLDLDGIFAKDAIPGEWYWYRQGHRRVGMIMHLAGVLPAGILACLQFTPVIRHKAIIVHRITGYFAITGLVVGIVGAFMIMDTAVGGEPSLRLWIGLVGVSCILALLLAYINIKCLQIDQHRAWMMRAWGWAASIITLRLILLAAIAACQHYNVVYYKGIACNEIYFMYQHAGLPATENPTLLLYPACGTNASTNSLQVLVSSKPGGPENAAVLIRNVFVMAAWLATPIHVFVVEVYLWLTPAESYRLRVVSYERQVERGWRKAGQIKDTGLGATRIGDAPPWWSLPASEYRKIEHFNNNSTDEASDTTTYDAGNTIMAESNVQKPHYEHQAGLDGSAAPVVTRGDSSMSERTLHHTQ